jgi:hypothetical protein
MESFERHAADHIPLFGKRRFQASSSAKDARIWDAIASCSSGGNAPIFFNAFSSKEDMR